MINVVVVDDEADARESLTIRLNEYFEDIKVIASADTVSSGIDVIKKNKPELVFLDIELGDGNAFDLIDKFEEIHFEVIFTTAYDNYTLKAIKTNALDYLMKPIDLEELQSAIQRFRDIREAGKIGDRIGIFPHQSASIQSYKLLLPSSYGFEFVTIENILYCAADRNYTKVILQSGKEKLISKTLREFEDQLTEFFFFRIHQSYLINIFHIEKYVKSKGGLVTMANGDSLKVSNNKKEQFLAVFKRIK